jgi:hypothetical protein
MILDTNNVFIKLKIILEVIKMDKIIEYLPFIIPIVILELALMFAAIFHILKHNTYKIGNRTIWILISFIQIIGPITYFVFGRGDE